MADLVMRIYLSSTVWLVLFVAATLIGFQQLYAYKFSIKLNKIESQQQQQLAKLAAENNQLNEQLKVLVEANQYLSMVNQELDLQVEEARHTNSDSTNLTG